MVGKNKCSKEESKILLNALKIRFEKNMQRHEGLHWSSIQSRLEGHSAKLWSLFRMEETGGEPDVTGYDKITGQYIFCDCSAESPKGRRSLCYDRAALDSRKEYKPSGCALDFAADMGVEVLNEALYKVLQQLGTFDAKTSSWLKTPDDIRQLGGAIFGDVRYNTVFIYHNGAESYYAARGFRATLRV